MKEISVLVLAAGKSARMKRPKQLLPIENSTLLGIALQHALASTATSVFCVLGANAEEIEKSIKQPSVRIIKNKHWEDGLSSSIESGVSFILKTAPTTSAVLIQLADQPLVDADYINEMINTGEQHPEKIVASNYGAFYGVPALFPKHYFEELLKLKGDTGAKVFLNNSNTSVIGLVSAEKLKDIDTPQQYTQFLNRNEL